MVTHGVVDMLLASTFVSSTHRSATHAVLQLRFRKIGRHDWKPTSATFVCILNMSGMNALKFVNFRHSHLL